MNWDVVRIDWHYFQQLVRARWADLSDGQLETIKGCRPALSDQIRATYGVSSDQAESEIRAFEVLHGEYRPWLFWPLGR